MLYSFGKRGEKECVFKEAAFREGRKLESPDSVENCVSLWSGASHKDVTVCPVKGRAYEVYAKSCPIYVCI